MLLSLCLGLDWQSWPSYGLSKKKILRRDFNNEYFETFCCMNEIILFFPIILLLLPRSQYVYTCMVPFLVHYNSMQLELMVQKHFYHLFPILKPVVSTYCISSSPTRWKANYVSKLLKPWICHPHLTELLSHF